jgi:glyoxylase-like metal-dependent hydrolase (beta-lactamase superfamily II)
VVESPRVTRLLAPNPSPMTLEGTNTYLIDTGDGSAMVIDPGPANEQHLAAIAAEAGERGLKIAAILVTHGHPDHAPGAAPLALRTGAPIYAHASARFPHDRRLDEGSHLTLGKVTLRAIDAPGHARDHLVFYLEKEAALFTGDVVIGRGTVVIAPPNGDMRAYQATLRRLRDEFPSARRIYGGHGAAIDDPRAKLDEYIAHRQAREAALLAALGEGPQTIPELVARLYVDVAPVLWPAAERQILAYLIALEREGRVRARDLPRSPSVSERALLAPDLSKLADPESAAVAAAELGFDAPLVSIATYELTR